MHVRWKKIRFSPKEPIGLLFQWRVEEAKENYFVREEKKCCWGRSALRMMSQMVEGSFAIHCGTRVTSFADLRPP